METARHWRLRAQRYRLLGEECPGCKQRLFPPRAVCPHCAAPARAAFQLSGRGSVLACQPVEATPAGLLPQAAGMPRIR